MRAALGCVICCLVIVAPAGAASGTLRGIVVDAEGAVIGMAHVLVHEDVTGKDRNRVDDRTVRSGRDGRFSIQLEAGFYDVCVMVDAFVPVCQKVKISDGKTAEPRFRLKLDLRVIELVADTFPPDKRR